MKVSVTLTKWSLAVLCPLRQIAISRLCPHKLFPKELNVNRLLIALLALISVAAAQAASFTRFQGYESSGAIQELQVFEVSPSDIKNRVFSIQADGKTYELGDIKLTRTSTKYNVEFELNVQLTTQTGPAPAPVTTGHLTKISPNPMKSVNLTLRKSFNYGVAVPQDPCQQPGGCNNFPYTFKETRRKATPAELANGFGSFYYAQSFRIKSVDYDWETGEWTRLILTETLYSEMQPLNKPNGGMTVGNGPR